MKTALVRAQMVRGFERWGYTLARHPWWAIMVLLALTLGVGSQALHLRFDTSPERFLAEGHPIRTRYVAFRQQFGQDDAILVALRTANVFDLDFLSWLRDVHRTLEDRVPHLDEVTSLINARNTRGEGDELIVEDLLERWPRNERELEQIAARARANPLYERLILSEDATLTTISVRLSPYSALSLSELDELGFDEGSENGEPTFLTGTESGAAVDATQAVLEEYARDDVEVFTAGMPVLNERLVADMQRDLVVFSAVSIVVIACVLGLLFRRTAGIVLPLLVVVLALGTTFGIAGLRGRPVSVTAQIVPTFLIAVGTSAAIHLLVIFFQRLDAGAPRVQAVAGALGHAGLAIVMTSLTTAGGLASFLVADLQPVAELGLLAPIGVLMGLLYCLVLLPALLLALPLRRKPNLDVSQRRSWIARTLVRGGDLAVQHPRTVLLVTGAFLLCAAAGLPRLSFEHDPLRWFPEGDPLRQSTEQIDKELGGSLSLEVVMDTQQPQGLYEPAMMNALERLRERSGEFRDRGRLRVEKTLSVADVLKEIHQALNENRADYYAIPQDRELIAQELLLFEGSGSDDLEDFVDTQFSQARFTARAPWVPPTAYHAIIPTIERTVRAEFGPSVAVHTTGVMPLMAAALDAVERGLVRSYSLALLVITPLMMLLIGSLRGGLVSMVPNLAPIICVLGFLGWFGGELDMFKMLIGSIAIGLAVDDTIHFMHHFYRYFEQTGDVRISVRRTLETTGQALLTTTIVLTLGFLTYAFSNMANLVHFGLITAAAIVLAFLFDVIVAPALVVYATRGRRAALVTDQPRERLHETS